MNKGSSSTPICTHQQHDLGFLAPRCGCLVNPANFKKQEPKKSSSIHIADIVWLVGGQNLVELPFPFSNNFNINTTWLTWFWYATNTMLLFPTINR